MYLATKQLLLCKIDSSKELKKKYLVRNFFTSKIPNMNEDYEKWENFYYYKMLRKKNFFFHLQFPHHALLFFGQDFKLPQYIYSIPPVLSPSSSKNCPLVMENFCFNHWTNTTSNHGTCPQAFLYIQNSQADEIIF